MKKVGERLVRDKGEEWYAFVPEEPLVFGHILLTVGKRPTDREGVCEEKYRNLWSTPKDILQNEIVGVRECMNGLVNIPFVKRVYVVVAGEERSVHHHFHLIPRYEFRSGEERDMWGKEHTLDADDPKWIEFYKSPTMDCKHSEGFQYIGELERVYNECKDNEYYPKTPSKDLLKEMARKIKGIVKR